MQNSLQTPVRENPTGRIHQLDGWRAIAALTVVLAHFLGNAHARAASHIPGLPHFLHFTGNVGVQALFIISGFVICRLLIIEEQRHGSFSLRWFYTRRVLRVLPPFYLYLATLAVLAHFGMVVITGRQLAKAALFLVDFHSFSAPWLIGHAWSLSVEEQFYLFFPFILWLTPVKWRSVVFGIICTMFVASAITIAHTDRLLAVTSGVMVGFIGIFCGVLIGLHEEKARGIVRKVPAFVVLLLAAIVLLLGFREMHGMKWALLQAVVLPPIIGLFLVYTLEQESWFRSLLCWGPVRAIGVTSYALYLWQQLFTGTSSDYHGVGRFFPYMLPALLLIVPLSWFLIEKRSIQLGKNLSRGVRVAKPSHPPVEGVVTVLR
jgi:peptidoglycan/LPS O-acetylase OafA/YrhL